jgi:hypothetical protein
MITGAAGGGTAPGSVRHCRPLDVALKSPMPSSFAVGSDRHARGAAGRAELTGLVRTGSNRSQAA